MNAAPTASTVEVIRLARALGVPVERLEHLAQLPAADIAALRHAVTDLFHDTVAPGLSKVAAVTKVIPPPIAAKVATRNDNPLWTAYLASVLDTARAVAVAQRLPARYLAAVATHLDLRRSAPVIAGLPRELLVAAARALAELEDWTTLGEMIEILPAAYLSRCVAVLDAGQIHSAAARIADPAALDRLIGAVSAPLAGQLRDSFGKP
ncbi:hypothetical protein LTV02_00340 [Nocardia yamanashiensis]|uniref:hypothetical protein n=1 Tax=Nocardia yamanashiensis TaxID=209247 RepID=UPI001E51AFF1|nr:hypothetical protein [Nocardia yamanashiensis]UGT41915.1 hypothetical protein LTV02_00340 [Nocardia yamanashiensis]